MPHIFITYSKYKKIFQNKKATIVYITFLKNMPKDANSQFLIHI